MIMKMEPALPETDNRLVAKRLRYIQRQRELHAERVNVAFEGRAPEGSGPANRHGMPKLPVGQRQVPNWPVLDLGDSPRIATEAWRLEVGGHCDNPQLSAISYRLSAFSYRLSKRLGLETES